MSYASGRGSPRPPAPMRDEHAQRLIAEVRTAEQEALRRRAVAAEQASVTATSEGMLITFQSWPGFELDLQSLDPLSQGPELVAVREQGEGRDKIQLATVHVLQGQLGLFLRKIEQYANEETSSGNPKNANMVERIAAIRLATIREIWTDDSASFPDPDSTVWWEAWLRRSDGNEIERLQSFATTARIKVDSRHLLFDNRAIVLVRATATQLAAALDLIDDFAELRSAHVNSGFFTGLSHDEQRQWVNDLLSRTDPPSTEAPAVCILDTGINRGHPLLEHSLAENDLHTCDPTWGVADHDGHGTGMAGVALYGDLLQTLQGSYKVRLRHRLESVKILPPANDTDPELYGVVTAEAVSRVEITAPQRRRAFSMAITAQPDRIAGTPTSWSATIDALAAGRQFDMTHDELRFIDEASAESHRLFIVSAGNIRDFGDITISYLDRCDTSPIDDPAQAWNALTVGAYTELVDVGGPGTSHEGWTPIAQPGDLSPFSRTGGLFERQWPTKPDIVLEGGNAAVSPAGIEVDWPDSLQILTTHSDPATRQLTTTNATSAATARAAYIAATIAAEYPAYWPETIRGLLVHSAEWTAQMRLQMSATSNNRRQRAKYIRRYGFGVPTLERAIRSAANALTLVVQDTIHPFRRGALREMHLHDLPWPRDVLADLAETPVTMRVTLSYFIEPSPTRRGWRRRYRYASHQLRFEIREPDETNDEFRKRINKRALGEEEERPIRSSDADGWYVGSETRNRGSVHTDIWQGTAADLASRGMVAIYPVSGWWKELPTRDQSELGVRYSLLISIETPGEDVDIYTPVATEAGVSTVIKT